MTTLLIMSACGLLALGLYHLSCAIVDVPTPKTSKMMLLAKKQTGIGKENLFDVYLTKIAERFSPLLKLDPIKRGKLALTLSIAGIYLSPEQDFIAVGNLYFGGKTSVMILIIIEIIDAFIDRKNE